MKNNCDHNPDHHIWNNNGTFWCHYTVHNDDYTKQRVRVSLGTKDIEIARALRDFLMEATPKIAKTIPRFQGQAMPNIPKISQTSNQAWRPLRSKGRATRSNSLSLKCLT